MLWPLILGGAGRLSLDALLARVAALSGPTPREDLTGWGLVLLPVGGVVAMLLPAPGLALAGLGAALLLAATVRSRRTRGAGAASHGDFLRSRATTARSR